MTPQQDAFPERVALGELRGAVDAHPYGAVGAALGLGYVLGGGLSSPLTARIVRAGLRATFRFVLLPVVEAELVRIARECAELEATRVREGANGAH